MCIHYGLMTTMKIIDPSLPIVNIDSSVIYVMRRLNIYFQELLSIQYHIIN